MSRPSHSDKKADPDQLALAPTVPELPAVRPEDAEEQRPAWLPPESTTAPAVSPIELNPATPSFQPSEPSSFGDRETILSRDTEISELPPIRTARNLALLLRMDGPDAGEVVALEDAEVHIGRHASTEVCVADHGVSRVHARITAQQGHHRIEDLHSSNGTFVKGERVKAHVLEDGDVVQIGPRVTFRYTIADERQVQLLRQMHLSSTRDALTGVYNRKHFTERFEAEFAYAARHEVGLGVVMFDIDHFKRINDSFGHPAGDSVLCHVAATIAQRMRAEDLFARYGGEEFMALLRSADLDATRQMAERMRVAISTHPAFVEGKHIPVTISAGCATRTCPTEPGTAALIALVDQRLYAAKRAGRNRVVSNG